MTANELWKTLEKLCILQKKPKNASPFFNMGRKHLLGVHLKLYNKPLQILCCLYGFHCRPLFHTLISVHDSSLFVCSVILAARDNIIINRPWLSEQFLLAVNVIFLHFLGFGQCKKIHSIHFRLKLKLFIITIEKKSKNVADWVEESHPYVGVCYSFSLTLHYYITQNVACSIPRRKPNWYLMCNQLGVYSSLFILTRHERKK